MTSCKISSRRLTGTIIFIFFVCPTIFFHVCKVCTRIAITKKYTLVPRRRRFPLFTSQVFLPWDPLMITISSCILDTIYICSWSMISSNVNLIFPLLGASIFLPGFLTSLFLKHYHSFLRIHPHNQDLIYQRETFDYLRCHLGFVRFSSSYLASQLPF